MVAPFVGAWIEIAIAVDLIRELMSLRSSERGLKSLCIDISGNDEYVAPFVGAWIEISGWKKELCLVSVAPFVGAWIEIG